MTRSRKRQVRQSMRSGQHPGTGAHRGPYGRCTGIQAVPAPVALDTARS
jgi:hypothetical protein